MKKVTEKPFWPLLSILTGVSLTVLSHSGSLTLPALPSAVFADSEVSTNAQMMAWSETTRQFNVTLQFDATPSNNVQVAFGTDTSADGNLSAEETRLTLGWDCGAWFISTDTATNRFIASPEDSTIQKKLSFTVNLGADGLPRTVELADGNTPLAFAGLTLLPAPPAWMYSTDWDLLKVIARGTDARNEQIMVKLTNDAIILLLR